MAIEKKDGLATLISNNPGNEILGGFGLKARHNTSQTTRKSLHSFQRKAGPRIGIARFITVQESGQITIAPFPCQVNSNDAIDIRSQLFKPASVHQCISTVLKYNRHTEKQLHKMSQFHLCGF